MIPSFRSICNFITTNLFLITTSIIDIHFTQSNSIIPLYLTTFVKNEVFVKSIEYFTKKHPDIVQERRVYPKEKYPFEFQLNLFFNSWIEVLYSFSIYSIFFQNNSEYNIFYDLKWFIPVSFLFEIIFDFFHYWTHRLVHENPTLYQLFHRKHHSHPHPNVYTTFYQDPIDLLITNMFPTMMAMYMVNQCFPMSYFMWRSINTYKVYIEICGHSGKDIERTCSFVQFIWITKWFGIDLYTEDHDRHHSNVTCNYSKRFMLWDKIFGTYSRKE